MLHLDQINFANKRALVRVDFNVPLNSDFQITDDTRLREALPTISKILQDGGSLVLISHLGRPKDGPAHKYSLQHLVGYLSEKLQRDIFFSDDCIGADAFERSSNLKQGEVLLLENLRFYKEETKGDREFAAKLAKHGQVYVNDAFGTAHRAHASTSIVAEFFEQKCCGYIMRNEIENAEKVLSQGEKPIIAIMGGAKISDKILIIENLLDRVDKILIGGGMSYTFFAAQGGKIGKSLVESDRLALAQTLIEKAKQKGVELILPIDSLAADAFSNDANAQTLPSDNISEDFMGLDIGAQAIQQYQAHIRGAKTILWNGPMGVFEFENFAKGTIAVAQAVVEATQNGAFSLIGGGDSAAAINQLGFGEQVSYVSTGGGALLEYMEGKVLPGIAALG